MESDRYSGVYRAYYGWAIYSDPGERENNGFEKAFEVIREASLLEPNETIIQVYFGQLLREKGELAHAAAVLRRVLKAEPNNSAARRGLNAIKAVDASTKYILSTNEYLLEARKRPDRLWIDEFLYDSGNHRGRSQSLFYFSLQLDCMNLSIAFAAICEADLTISERVDW